MSKHQEYFFKVKNHTVSAMAKSKEEAELRLRKAIFGRAWWLNEIKPIKAPKHEQEQELTLDQARKVRFHAATDKKV